MKTPCELTLALRQMRVALTTPHTFRFWLHTALIWLVITAIHFGVPWAFEKGGLVVGIAVGLSCLLGLTAGLLYALAGIDADVTASKGIR